MTKISSNYKFLGGYGLLVVANIIFVFATFKLLTDSEISYDKIDFNNETKVLFIYLIFIGINLIFLTLLATQCKIIVTDKNGITFINPFFPFLKQKHLWNYFDYYILVDEDSRYNKYEAVWLIKDKKIKGRFSSFYYSNYNVLKKQIMTDGHGSKDFNPFGQLFALLGWKKINNP